jgi:hypothetical protein
MLPRLAEAFIPKKSRGDKTAIELFISGIQGWNAARQRILPGVSEKASSS